ncbi:MAG: efflux RND transporter periplasmic adaptor subunit [Cyclobacteriaceae bacterium]
MLLIVAGACTEEKAAETKQPAAASPAVPVEGMVLKTESLDDEIYTTGTLLSNEEVELRPETSGRIMGIFFEEGSRVSKGQLLAKIDNRELNDQLKRLQIQSELASTEEARQKKLLDIEAISQEEYDITLNRLNTIEAEMDLVRTQISKTNIVSPFSGVVSLRYVSEGGYVSPTTLIASLQQINPIKLEFSVSEKYISDIKEGSAINFSVATSEETYQARVYAIDSKIDINTRTIKVRARSENPDNMLKPGAFARVAIVLKTFEDAILVPSDAILTELEGEKVFIAENGKAMPKRIRTGIRTEHMVQVVEGLTPQDTLVLTGLMSIQEGKPLAFKKIRKSAAEISLEQPNLSL